MVGCGARCLAAVPSWRDFVLPSRFPRKVAMAAAWLHAATLVLAIAGAAGSAWLMQDYTEEVDTGPAGAAVVHTTAHFSLTRYTLRRRIVTANSTFYTGERGRVQSVVDIAALAPLSRATLALLVTAICLTPASAAVAFCHAWARGRPRLVYALAGALSGTVALLSLLAFIVSAYLISILFLSVLFTCSRVFLFFFFCSSMPVSSHEAAGTTWAGASG